MNVADNTTKREMQPTDVEIVANRVRKRALAMNFNASSMASALDAPTSSISNYWTGKRIWPTELLPALAQLLDTNVDFLLSGKAVVGGQDSLNMVAVDEVDLSFGLGGSFAEDHPSMVTHYFPRRWVETITSTPASMLTIARGRGDSMQPTLQDGDMVILDRSKRTVHEQDAVWALTVGEIAMIKRLRVRGERVQILSDNDRVPIDDAHVDEINIVGRVIFIGRRI